MLFLWLKGHWFGWVVAFFPIAWLIQLFTVDNSDTPLVFATHMAGALAVSGMPYLIWGRPPKDWWT